MVYSLCTALSCSLPALLNMYPWHSCIFLAYWIPTLPSSSKSYKPSAVKSAFTPNPFPFPAVNHVHPLLSALSCLIAFSHGIPIISVSYSITRQWAPRGQQMNLIIFSITYLVDVKWHLLQKYQIITGAVLRAQCLGAYTEAGLCWWTMGNLLRHSSRRPCTVPSVVVSLQVWQATDGILQWEFWRGLPVGSIYSNMGTV